MKLILTFFALASFSSLFSQISINANIPSNINASSSVDADIKINKGAIGNFAKYQMDVPLGYVISSVDVKGGNFTFENQRAKIVWVSVPSEAEFIVKLKIQANSDATGSGSFLQKFFYLENNEKKEIEAAPIVVNIGGASSPVVSTPTETKPIESTKPAETKPTETVVKETKAVEVTKPIETKPVETIAKSTPSETKSSSTNKKTSTTSDNELGLTFKVQIGAYSSEPSKSKFSGAGNVNIDLINGMYKVTTGNFKTLDDAVKYRDELKSKGFNGFIAKYKSGVRIN